jgi:hypothetical protein
MQQDKYIYATGGTLQIAGYLTEDDFLVGNGSYTGAVVQSPFTEDVLCTDFHVTVKTPAFTGSPSLFAIGTSSGSLSVGASTGSLTGENRGTGLFGALDLSLAGTTYSTGSLLFRTIAHLESSGSGNILSMSGMTLQAANDTGHDYLTFMRIRNGTGGNVNMYYHLNCHSLD